MTDLTLCMIVRNEERALQKCLDSVRELAPEIVIVDTGSTDGTLPIARRNNAKISSFDFTNVDFAAARNHSLAQATRRWILVLDADETLDPASIPIIRDLLHSDPAGYFVARRNYASDTEGFTTDHVVRLFPNQPDYRYRGRVHETVQGPRLLPSRLHIDHTFVTDRETRRHKNQRYIKILLEEFEADPTDTTRLDFLAAEFHQLGEFDKSTEVLEMIVQLRPNDAGAHYFAGLAHSRTDPARARRDFEQALRLRPHYAEAQAFLTSLTTPAAIPSESNPLSAAILKTMSTQPAAPRIVHCVKLNRDLEGLAEVPFEGHPLGQRIYDNVSKQAWGMWVEHMKMLMNEYRLNLGTKEAQEFLLNQMEQYFFGDGSAPPPEFVASPQH